MHGGSRAGDDERVACYRLRLDGFITLIEETMAEGTFGGPAGRTRTAETAVWCGACGTWYGARWFRGIEAEADADLLATLLEDGLAGLNEATCPECGARHVISEPLVIHRPSEAQLLLLVPPDRLHRAEHARAALLAEIADGPGERLPDYAREPELVRGIAGLREALGERTTVARAPRAAVGRAAPEARPSRPGAGLLAALLDERPAESTAEPTDWDAAWSLEDSTLEHEPTRVSRVDMIAPRLPEGVDWAVEGGADDVRLVIRTAEAERASALLDPEASLRFQLHRLDDAHLTCLTLAPPRGAPAVWPLDPLRDADRLDGLARHFTVSVEVLDADGRSVGSRTFDPPLARNVADAVAELRSRGGSAIDAPELVDEILGRMRHNFRVDSFIDVSSAAEAQLAAGIVGYWTEPEREAYLIFVQSFPRVWFDRIVRRVIEAAGDYGVALPEHLIERARELGIVADESAWIRRALAAFAEVALQLKPSLLEPIDAWENWQMLLTRAEALGVPVDAEYEALALAAMKAAQAQVEREAGDDDDVAGVESIDDFEIIEDSTDGHFAVFEAELNDRGDAVLLGLLDDAERRASAAAILLRRGEAVYAPAVFEALERMDGHELAYALPVGLGMADALLPLASDALATGRPVLRLALVLFLAEAGVALAGPAAVDLLLDGEDDAWPPVAKALPRFGNALGPLLASIPLEGMVMERVAAALAELSPMQAERVYDARARSTSRVRACLQRASVLREERRPDHRSFAERLGLVLRDLEASSTQRFDTGGAP